MKYCHLFLLIFFLLLPKVFAESNIVITVGTTGDYLPLTWYEQETNHYSGKAIELIRAFAKSEQLTIKFINTTWPRLSEDLRQGKFQVAVGGISATSKRAKDFLFSAPIRIFGKVALVRCGEEHLYSTLSAIDNPQVRVVENRGGTNEEFALAHIKHARLILVHNNFLPFQFLKERQADIMFTDSIEASYQQSKKQGLCAANIEHLYTRAEKVFLFHPNEKGLRDRFNQWLLINHQ